MQTKLIFILTLLLLPLHALAESSETEQMAVGIAQSWLAQVDKGDYKTSWHKSAPLFKSTVDMQKWEQVAKDVRQPFGDVVGRSLKSATHTNSLPNAPTGDYVVLCSIANLASRNPQLKPSCQCLVKMANGVLAVTISSNHLLH